MQPVSVPDDNVNEARAISSKDDLNGAYIPARSLVELGNGATGGHTGPPLH
jgi:hypothetical protein